MERRQHRAALERERQREGVVLGEFRRDQPLEEEDGFWGRAMVEESSNDCVVGEDVGASDLGKQAAGVVDVAVGGEAEELGERERVGRVRESGMSENVGVDLIENSHVGTSLDE